MSLIPTYHPLHAIKDKLIDIFPKLDAVVLLYKQNKQLVAELNHELKTLSELDKIVVQKVRNSSLNYQWSRPEDFIFMSQHENIKQLELMDEYNNRLLLLHFQSSEDQLKDTIAICFPKDVVFFGLRKNLNSLTTDEKMLIGELLHKLLANEYNFNFKSNQQFALLQKYYELQNGELVKNHRNNFVDYLRSNCIQIAKKHSSLEIQIDEDALFFLIEQNVAFDVLDDILKNSILFCQMLSPNTALVKLNKLIIQTILLNHEYISPIQPIQMNADRAFDILTRYEEAAEKALQNGESINGRVIAAYLVPAISPPALTEALKKHKNKISGYLNEFPDRWPLIRKSLKPIREIEQFDSKVNSKLG